MYVPYSQVAQFSACIRAAAAVRTLTGVGYTGHNTFLLLGRACSTVPTGRVGVPGSELQICVKCYTPGEERNPGVGAGDRAVRGCHGVDILNVPPQKLSQ